jgi:hypothetical protein
MTANDLLLLIGVTLGGLASFMLALSVLLTVLHDRGR